MTAPLLALLVSALALVETPNGVPVHPGKAGETGRWQLTPAVRADRGRELRANGTPITDEAIARAQVLWLERQLEGGDISPLPFNIALAWNCGLTRTLEGKAPMRSYEFASRVCNLTTPDQRP